MKQNDLFILLVFAICYVGQAIGFDILRNADTIAGRKIESTNSIQKRATSNPLGMLNEQSDYIADLNDYLENDIELPDYEDSGFDEKVEDVELSDSIADDESLFKSLGSNGNDDHRGSDKDRRPNDSDDHRGSDKDTRPNDKDDHRGSDKDTRPNDNDDHRGSDKDRRPNGNDDHRGSDKDRRPNDNDDHRGSDKDRRPDYDDDYRRPDKDRRPDYDDDYSNNWPTLKKPKSIENYLADLIQCTSVLIDKYGVPGYASNSETSKNKISIEITFPTGAHQVLGNSDKKKNQPKHSTTSAIIWNSILSTIHLFATCTESYSCS